MRPTGRVRCSTTSIIIFVYSYFKTAVSSEYGVPIEIKLWDEERRPISQMVDVTNEFGLKVLAEHNFLNDNNIAFSPYGLMGILVALYEGIDGDSSYQMQRAIQLPWHRNIMRIGFRDIHRTLKTYFVPEEGFLAGLALNNENVTFNESYKRVLRFYGFDLENDQLPTFPPQGNNTSTTESTAIKSSTIENKISVSTDKTSTYSVADMTTKNKPPVETMTTEATTAKSSAIINDISEPNVKESTPSTVAMTTDNKPNDEITSTMPKQETTTILNKQTLANDDVPESTTLSIISPTSTPQSTTIIPTSEQSVTTELPSMEIVTQLASDAATISLTTELSNISSTMDNLITTTTTVSSTVDNLMTTTSMTSSNLETDGETISQQTSQATVALTAETMINQANSTTISDLTVSTERITDTESTTITSTVAITETTQTIDVSTALLETQNTDDTVSTTNTITTPDSTTSMTTNPTLQTLRRRKKSLVDFIYTNPPYMDDYLLYRSLDIPPAIPEQSFGSTLFMANGLKSIQVTYMHYDTVLEHAYLPHLEASALRLPLDSDRYYLLVVLPGRGGPNELGRLLARMARESDLSDIYAALRPRRVKGIVPSFTVKGHVTLTTDLQKLGIRDVFEPRQGDFSPMTKQSGVYVRSIEQAVSVAIRKYKADDHKKNRYVITNRKPVKFYATYPFLYFVMDSSIHVSLMAGKMVDPLNSRIL